MPRYAYGGQALIEGVMMRGRDAIAVALRAPDGRIVWEAERLDTGFHKNPASRWPFVRGLVILYEQLVIGTRWLMRAASIQVEDEGVELGKGSIALMLLITAVIGVGLFFLLPLAVATFTAGNNSNDLVQHVIEGLVRVALFLGYLAILSRTPDISRVFAYHGAEHMTIHALEHGDPLTPASIRKYPTAHPRCGTEFLVVVVLLSIIAFGLVGRQTPLVMIGSRILLIPVIAAVGYELLRLGARHRGNPIVRVVMWPGILVQMITTKQPTDDMIEVAIVAVEEALRADGEIVPDGGLNLARSPMPAPGETAAKARAAAERATAEPEAATGAGAEPEAATRAGAEAEAATGAGAEAATKTEPEPTSAAAAAEPVPTAAEPATAAAAEPATFAAAAPSSPAAAPLATPDA